MKYLTYDEYTRLKFSKIEEKAFEKIEPFAEKFLDRVTNNFYCFHSLDEDTFLYRKNAFKEAMAWQCDYLFLTNATSIQEVMGQSPTSVSVGRMHLELPKSGPSTVGSTMVCAEAYRSLAHTGLLYRGVTVR